MQTLIIGEKSEIGTAITALIETARGCQAMTRHSVTLKEHSDSVLNRAQELCLLLNIKAKQVKKEEEEA